MRDFASETSRIRASSLPLRATLTGFLGFVLIGEVSGIVMGALQTGYTPTGIARYYRGYESELQFPKELSVLLENTHFHVFIVPLVLLVLTHVVFMTSLSERRKLAITVASYASALVELAAPWAVRYLAAGFAWLHLAGALVFHATVLAMVAVALYECWLAPAPEDDEP